MVGGGDRFYLKFWVKLTPLERNRRFSAIFARSASAVAPSKRSSINTNRKSTIRAFQWAWHERGLKTQNGRFPCKITLRL